MLTETKSLGVSKGQKGLRESAVYQECPVVMPGSGCRISYINPAPFSFLKCPAFIFATYSHEIWT